MRPGLIGILLVTLHAMFVFSASIDYLGNDNSMNESTNDNSEPPVCIFGFVFDPTDRECHLIVNLAGKVDNIPVFIICPSGYTYSGSGKQCKKLQGRHMIDAPLICSHNYRLDPKGKCRDKW